jgi:PadR family transcriptional regulator, regulatory protein PadR
MSAPTELVKGNAAVLILSCLAKEPMHGYRIVKELDSMSESYFQMREGTLYPHLHRLEEDGLIEGYWEKTSGTRERRLYRITDKGTAELARLRSAWRTFQANLNRVIDQGAGA